MPRQASSTASVQRGPRQRRWASGFMLAGKPASLPRLSRRCSNTPMPIRRLILLGTAAAVAMPALSSTRRTLAAMTDGPFYPPRAWRERNGAQDDDWDADLTRVQRHGRVF